MPMFDSSSSESRSIAVSLMTSKVWWQWMVSLSGFRSGASLLRERSGSAGHCWTYTVPRVFSSREFGSVQFLLWPNKLADVVIWCCTSPCWFGRNESEANQGWKQRTVNACRDGAHATIIPRSSSNIAAIQSGKASQVSSWLLLNESQL